VATDPYKYFRIEARELLEGLSRGVLELEKGMWDKERIGRLLRLAHTLKGASRVVRLVRVAEGAHAVEEVLAPYREGLRPVPEEDVSSLFRLLDTIGTHVSAIEPAAVDGKAPPTPGTAADEPLETVRVEVHEMESLLDGVTEATVHVNALRRDTRALEGAVRLASLLVDSLGPRRAAEPNGADASGALTRARSLADELERTLETVQRSVSVTVAHVSSELMQVRDAANRLRLVPVASVFGPLERAARDAAQSLQKKVAFHATGGETRLDANLIVVLRDALVQLVRNAVAHGIEATSERAAAGKAPEGRVDIEVERRGERVAFRCRDDGRGVDVVALRRAAASAGRLTPSQADALDLDGIFGLILKGGLTTTRTVTEVSGRGIGLDVVREAAVRLKGEVTVQSDAGRGTTIEICVPVSLLSLSVLVVDAAGTRASVPLDSVRRTLRLADSDIARSAEGDSILHDGKVIPFVPLGSALRRPGAQTRGQKLSTAVVIQAGPALAAVAVDRLIGTANVIVRPIPPEADVDPIVSGASLDAEGNPQLVLYPAGIVAAARGWTGQHAKAEAATLRPILVVDDSLTTRMLEQSILESAGYEVALAASAEEALGKAAEQAYGLFIVDVEMPGMNGFEFVARTRADPILKATPAILVTSRSSDEDRRRGREAGARAYIVKGEFDQGELLRAIRELLG
jgi:two-component system, chemotaxis family, sensor kinase CheA